MSDATGFQLRRGGIPFYAEAEPTRQAGGAKRFNYEGDGSPSTPGIAERSSVTLSQGFNYEGDGSPSTPWQRRRPRRKPPCFNYEGDGSPSTLGISVREGPRRGNLVFQLRRGWIPFYAAVEQVRELFFNEGFNYEGDRTPFTQGTAIMDRISFKCVSTTKGIGAPSRLWVPPPTGTLEEVSTTKGIGAPSRMRYYNVPGCLAEFQLRRGSEPPSRAVNNAHDQVRVSTTKGIGTPFPLPCRQGGQG